MTMIHWMGIRDHQSLSAQLVWGTPDFVHMHHDHRSSGDIDWDTDTVLIGDHATEYPIEWTHQDHEFC